MKITIEEMLVERDIISRQQLERVKEIQKSHEDKSRTDMLLLLGYTTEDVIMNCFSDRDDMEIIHLEERTADPAAIEMLPESFIVNNEIVPLCLNWPVLHCCCRHFAPIMDCAGSGTRCFIPFRRSVMPVLICWEQRGQNLFR